LTVQQGDGGQAFVCNELPCNDQVSRGDYLSTMEWPTEAPRSYVDDGGPII